MPFAIPEGTASITQPNLFSREGHDSWQCLSGPDIDHGACYECGLPGHLAKSCPILSSLDSGIYVYSYRCFIHDTPRGYRNIQHDPECKWRCEPDSECPPRWVDVLSRRRSPLPLCYAVCPLAVSLTLFSSR